MACPAVGARTARAGAIRLGIAARRAAFRVGLRRVHRLPVPVVSFGNVTVGGTGKTPATLLARRVGSRARGERPVIVTRGYGGNLKGRIVTVGRDGQSLYDAREIGDEAVLLAERFPGPVVCGADRVAAAQHALDEHAAHGDRARRRLPALAARPRRGRRAGRRSAVGFGNGALLPAGPLREPLARARTRRRDRGHQGRARLARRRGSGAARAGTYRRFAAELEPTSLVVSEDGLLVARPLGDLVGRRVVTVSAIAQPQSFYELLGQLEVRAVEVLEFPDHHQFTQADWQRITQAGHRADLVVCTEKDIVKLRRFPFARGGLAALRVDFALRSGTRSGWRPWWRGASRKDGCSWPAKLLVRRAMTDLAGAGRRALGR